MLGFKGQQRAVISRVLGGPRVYPHLRYFKAHYFKAPLFLFAEVLLLLLMF